VAHFRKRFLPVSGPLLADEVEVAEVVAIINLLARKLSRAVYTGARSLAGRSSSNSWSDSRRVASPEERCFHLLRHLSQRPDCILCCILFPSSLAISPIHAGDGRTLSDPQVSRVFLRSVFFIHIAPTCARRGKELS